MLLAWNTAMCALLAGCHSNTLSLKPSIHITHLPPDAAGGPEQVDSIEGRVNGAHPGDHIVIYARDGAWYIQPYAINPFIPIQSDQTWKTSTHLGTDYAAILVDQTFHPLPQMAELPQDGNGILAVLASKGGPANPAVTKVIHFSGYDWRVRSAPSDRGGEASAYDPNNAWTDEKGYLHLRMGPKGDKWACAEVNLTRSLGYGTYRFVVEDTTHLPPSGVLGIYTLDERRGEMVRYELDLELSQWGKPASQNAQYVVQPYYLPANISRFSVPPGITTHELGWQPGSAVFRTYARPDPAPDAKTLYQHDFTSGVPAAAAESIHMGLYDFYHSKSNMRRPVEVVIEKFEYLP